MISICPKCAGKISLPEDVDRQADCECPLCQARYSVAEVFHHAAPAVTIFGKPTGDDDELSLAPAEASEPRLFAMLDGDGPDEDTDSEIAAVLDNQSPTASFDVELTSGNDDELATDSDETDFDDGAGDPNLDGAFGLDSDDFSIEFQEDDALAAIDASTADDDAGNGSDDDADSGSADRGVAVLAVVSKGQAEAWLDQEGTPAQESGTSEDEG